MQRLIMAGIAMQLLSGTAMAQTSPAVPMTPPPPSAASPDTSIPGVQMPKMGMQSAPMGAAATVTTGTTAPVALPAPVPLAPVAETKPAVPPAGMPLASTPPTVSLSTTPTTTARLASPAGGLPGANSFTEGQAQSRIEAAGYSNVTGLAKDSDGIWRGKATKGDVTAMVGLDFKGNVVTQ